jgi:RNA polymerase sigma-70 factor (ECF subfamily)
VRGDEERLRAVRGAAPDDETEEPVVTATSATAALPFALTAGARERRAGGADRDDVRAAQAGEREAFDRLVERYQRDVYRLCYRFSSDHHDANDLAQEAFVRAYRALPRFRGDSAFSTWLYRIAVNVCLSFRAARRPASLELPESLPDACPSVAEAVHRAQTSARVQAAVERLPTKQRATVILKVYQELTHEEVARVLGTTVGTVKANLFHALANLRRQLVGEPAGGRGRGGSER